MYRTGNKILTYQGKMFGIAPPFTPASIANLTAWYGDYVNGGTLRTTLNNGANVNQWDDSSGNGFHLANKISQPTYTSAGNSVNIGVGDALWCSRPVLSGASVCTIFMAYKYNDGTQHGYIMGFGIASGGGAFDIANLNATNGTFNLTNESVSKGALTQTLNTGQKAVFSLNMPNANTNTAVLRKNASAKTLSGTDFTLNITSSGKFIIGGYIDSGGNATVYSSTKDFNAYEFIIYNRSLTTAEVSQVETYLNAKYTIY